MAYSGTSNVVTATPVPRGVTDVNDGASVAAKFPNNRWMATDVAYDPAGTGNQTQSPQGTYEYDAENRLTAAVAGLFSTTYGYDGEGRRVLKTVGGLKTTFVYDAMGQLVAEYGGTASPSTGLRYVTSDYLGSTRLTTKADGTVDECIDYVPFGERIPQAWGARPACAGSAVLPAAAVGVANVLFTGKERDAETGLDYFGARYLSSAQGRFTSPDAPFADQKPGDPQSWNLYAYARNNPLFFTDPTGREVASSCPVGDTKCSRQESEAAQAIFRPSFWRGVWKDLKNSAKVWAYGAALAGDQGQNPGLIPPPNLEGPSNVEEEAGMAVSTAMQIAPLLFVEGPAAASNLLAVLTPELRRGFVRIELSLDLRLAPLAGFRPSHSSSAGRRQVLGNRTLGDAATVGDGPLAQAAGVQVQNSFDFAHRQPLLWQLRGVSSVHQRALFATAACAASPNSCRSLFRSSGQKLIAIRPES